jgi:DNA-binding IclR family transcriptional regulator
MVNRERTRTSPGVERAAAILQLLAATPDEAFSLSEICRRLDLSYASAHALATALERADLVRRHAQRRTYSLGPALIALGSAARRGYRVVDDAQPHMDTLSQDLGLACHAGLISGDEVVVVACAGPLQPFGFRVQVGERLPLAPPLGIAYVAWSDDVAVADYLRRARAELTSDEVESYRRSIAAVRTRGYAVVLDSAARRRFAEVAESGGRDELDEILAQLAHEQYATQDLDRDARYPVVAITAPVFGPDAAVMLMLAIVGFGETLSVEQITQYARRLCDAAGAITEAVGGMVLAR